MKYDIYSDGQLIYSTDAPAAQVQLRQDEQVALHGSSELLTQDAWADLITTDTGLQAIPTRAITYWAFRRRFEHAERVAIELAALDDPLPPCRSGSWRRLCVSISQMRMLQHGLILMTQMPATASTRWKPQG